MHMELGRGQRLLDLCQKLVVDSEHVVHADFDAVRQKRLALCRLDLKTAREQPVSIKDKTLSQKKRKILKTQSKYSKSKTSE